MKYCILQMIMVLALNVTYILLTYNTSKQCSLEVAVNSNPKMNS